MPIRAPPEWLALEPAALHVEGRRIEPALALRPIAQIQPLQLDFGDPGTEALHVRGREPRRDDDLRIEGAGAGLVGPCEWFRDRGRSGCTDRRGSRRAAHRRRGPCELRAQLPELVLERCARLPLVGERLAKLGDLLGEPREILSGLLARSAAHERGPGETTSMRTPSGTLFYFCDGFTGKMTSLVKTNPQPQPQLKLQVQPSLSFY